MMDRASLRAVEDTGKIGYNDVKFLSLHTAIIPRNLPDTAAALLIETRAYNKEILQAQIDKIVETIKPFKTLGEIQFTTKPSEYSAMWDVRKGLFTKVSFIY